MFLCLTVMLLPWLKSTLRMGSPSLKNRDSQIGLKFCHILLIRYMPLLSVLGSLKAPCNRADRSVNRMTRSREGRETVGQSIIREARAPVYSCSCCNPGCAPNRDILDIDLSSGLTWQRKHLNLWLLSHKGSNFNKMKMGG